MAISYDIVTLPKSRTELHGEARDLYGKMSANLNNNTAEDDMIFFNKNTDTNEIKDIMGQLFSVWLYEHHNGSYAGLSAIKEDIANQLEEQKGCTDSIIQIDAQRLADIAREEASGDGEATKETDKEQSSDSENSNHSSNSSRDEEFENFINEYKKFLEYINEAQKQQAAADEKRELQAMVRQLLRSMLTGNTMAMPGGINNPWANSSASDFGAMTLGMTYQAGMLARTDNFAIPGVSSPFVGSTTATLPQFIDPTAILNQFITARLFERLLNGSSNKGSGSDSERSDRNSERSSDNNRQTKDKGKNYTWTRNARAGDKVTARENKGETTVEVQDGNRAAGAYVGPGVVSGHVENDKGNYTIHLNDDGNTVVVTDNPNRAEEGSEFYYQQRRIRMKNGVQEQPLGGGGLAVRNYDTRSGAYEIMQNSDAFNQISTFVHDHDGVSEERLMAFLQRKKDKNGKEYDSAFDDISETDMKDFIQYGRDNPNAGFSFSRSGLSNIMMTALAHEHQDYGFSAGGSSQSVQAKPPEKVEKPKSEQQKGAPASADRGTAGSSATTTAAAATTSSETSDATHIARVRHIYSQTNAYHMLEKAVKKANQKEVKFDLNNWWDNEGVQYLANIGITREQMQNFETGTLVLTKADKDKGLTPEVLQQIEKIMKN